MTRTCIIAALVHHLHTHDMCLQLLQLDAANTPVLVTSEVTRQVVHVLSYLSGGAGGCCL